MPIEAANILWANVTGLNVYYQPYFPIEWYAIIMLIAITLFLASHALKRGNDIVAGMGFMFSIASVWMVNSLARLPTPAYDVGTNGYSILVQIYGSPPMTAFHIVFAILMFLNIIYVIVEERKKDIIPPPESPYPKLETPRLGVNQSGTGGLL